MLKTLSVPAAAAVAAALVVGMATSRHAPADEKANAAPPVRWEYRVVNAGPTEKELNRHGDDGWELVSMNVTTNSPLYLVFKRPKK